MKEIVMNDCWKNLPTVLVKYIMKLWSIPYRYMYELKLFHRWTEIHRVGNYKKNNLFFDFFSKKESWEI